MRLANPHTVTVMIVRPPPPHPQKKIQVDHPCYKILNPKFTFTLYIYRATMTGYLRREVRTEVSYGYTYLAYDRG